MSSSRSLLLMIVSLALVCLGLHGSGAEAAGLSSTFYARSCPNVASVVRSVLHQAHATDSRIYASLLRLSFHDCFVGGCDASVLLDGTPAFQSEKVAPANNNSARGFLVIDEIKAAVEKACPGVVSCADVLALSSSISVELAGGPKWPVLLGRRDSKTAHFAAAKQMPKPTDSLTTLRQKFASVGLDDTDLVVLNGAHTFGRGQCKFVTDRLYNYSNTGKPDPYLDSTYGWQLHFSCPLGGDATVLNKIDPSTPEVFDNHYFANVIRHRGLFQSDQELYNSPTAASTTAPLFRKFAASQPAFFASFAASMDKMTSINPLTGSAGEIRRNCRKVNGS